MRIRSWNEEDLREAVLNSLSFRQVLKKLNLREAGGNYDQVKKYIKENNLSIKHFKGRAWNKGLKGFGKPHIPLKDIIIKNSYYQSFKLKNRLLKEGLKLPLCEQCGWAKKTENGYLPLELDHINGNRHDNRLENLRILCPNCHSLTSNHKGRSGKGKKKKAWVAKR